MGTETIIAATLTFMVWSYLLGDNPAFRAAEHLLVGTAAGYAAVVTWFNVVQPALRSAVTPQSTLLTVAPLVLCALLVARVRPAWSRWAGISLAFLIGVGSALAIGGALFGTLWSQVTATAGLSLNPADYNDAQSLPMSAVFWQNLAILIGTIGTFVYFAFHTQSRGLPGQLLGRFTRFWSGVGLWVITIALAALFANAAMARFTLLIGRVQWLLDVFGLSPRSVPPPP